MNAHRLIGFWLVLCLFLPFGFGFDLVESDDPVVSDANKKFRQQKYVEALELYNQAIETHGPGPILHFNRGATLERLGKHKEAMEEYLKGLSGADDKLKARNYYNMGNTLMAQKKIREAIDSYKRSLRLQPGDEDAVFNLELAQYLLKKAEEEAKKRQEQQDQQKSGGSAEPGRSTGGTTTARRGAATAGRRREPGRTAAERRAESRTERGRGGVRAETARTETRRKSATRRRRAASPAATGRTGRRIGTRSGRATASPGTGSPGVAS